MVHPMDEAAALRSLAQAELATSVLAKPGMQEAINRLLEQHRVLPPSFGDRLAEAAGLSDFATRIQGKLARSGIGAELTAHVQESFAQSNLGYQLAETIRVSLADYSTASASWGSIIATAEALAPVADEAELEGVFATAGAELRAIEDEVSGDESAAELKPISVTLAFVYARIAVAAVLVMLFQWTDFDLSQVDQATLNFALELLGLVPARQDEHQSPDR